MPLRPHFREWLQLGIADHCEAAQDAEGLDIIIVMLG